MTGTLDPTRPARRARSPWAAAHGALTLALAVAVAVLLYRDLRTPDNTPLQSVAVTEAGEARPAVIVADLAARVAEVARERPDKTDTSIRYFNSEDASVHLHVIGFGQSCPLHIHRQAHETTAVVTGNPEVTHVYRSGDATTTRASTPSPGTAIYSPPYAGHMWVNTSRDEAQGNLVIASPPFDGNLYVSEDDDRLLRGDAPAFFDPDAILQAYRAGGTRLHVERLPYMGGKLTGLVVGDRTELREDAGWTIFYVARGQGRLAADETYDLRAQCLAIVAPGIAVELEADADSPLVLLAFKPHAGRRRAFASG